MVCQRKIWTPLSYGYCFLEMAPGPPRAGSGPSKKFFAGPPLQGRGGKGGTARGQVRKLSRALREQDGCWPQVPLTRQSPPNYMWYYRKSYKQKQNIRILSPLPKRRTSVILMIHDETTWYGVMVTIIMRQLLHLHRLEKHVGLQ